MTSDNKEQLLKLINIYYASMDKAMRCADRAIELSKEIKGIEEIMLLCQENVAGVCKGNVIAAKANIVKWASRKERTSLHGLSENMESDLYTMAAKYLAVLFQHMEKIRATREEVFERLKLCSASFDDNVEALVESAKALCICGAVRNSTDDTFSFNGSRYGRKGEIQ